MIEGSAVALQPSSVRELGNLVSTVSPPLGAVRRTGRISGIVLPPMNDGSRDLDVLKALMDELPLGVIVLDTAGEVVFYNRYEEQLAQRDRVNVIGRNFFREVAPCMRVAGLVTHFERLGEQPLHVDLDFQFDFPFIPRPRDVRIRLRSFEADGAPYGVLYIEDCSAEVAMEQMRETLTRLLVHDLKSPLSVLQLSLEELAKRELEDEDLAAVGDALRASQRLDRMVIGLLDLSAMRTGLVPITRRVTDVAELATTAVGEIEPLAKQASIDLAVDIPDDAIEAPIDRDLVRRAIDNLLDNAIRHAPPEGHVSVAVEPTDTHVLVRVTDDGPGIPEAARAILFEPGGRELASRNYGLGLTFVRLAARAHGGEITVRDPEEGTGTIFVLSLPRLIGD